MKQHGILIAALCLAACGSEAPQTPAEPEAAGAAQLELQPIGAPEFQENHISMAGCAFAPEGGGAGALFVTDGDRGFIKTNGSVAPLAKFGETYAGGGYTVALTLSGEPKPVGARVGHDAHLTVSDGRGVTVYDAAGKAECAS